MRILDVTTWAAADDDEGVFIGHDASSMK